MNDPKVTTLFAKLARDLSPVDGASEASSASSPNNIPRGLDGDATTSTLPHPAIPAMRASTSSRSCCFSAGPSTFTSKSAGVNTNTESISPPP